MAHFPASPRPTDTIWGVPDDAAQVVPGIWEVGTPSHGGLVLSPERAAAMPEALALNGCSYEEDVDWCLPVLAFEAEFTASRTPGAAARTRLAHDFARNWHPDRYERFTGKPVEIKDSYVKKRRAAREALVGQLVVTSAYGRWADWVPEGKVGVVGRLLERVDYLGNSHFTGPPIQALVDADRYDSSREVNGFDAIGAVPFEAETPAPPTKEVALP